MQCVWNVVIDPLRNQSQSKLACSKPHLNPLVDRDLAQKQHQHQHQQQFQLKRKHTIAPGATSSSPQKRQKPGRASQTVAGSEPVSSSVTLSPSVQTNSATASAIHAAADNVVALVTPDRVLGPDSHTAQLTQQQQQQQQPPPSPILPVSDEAQQSSAGPSHKQQHSHQPVASPDTEAKARNRAHERIEANLNLQILLKHDELRLIEQELGKCQIALEQLRRCHVVPYPGQLGSNASTQQNIISGAGPALEPLAGYSRPAYPAPFGVQDGPYSRHYAQWLLQDSTFDASLPRQPRMSSSLFQAVPARSTRTCYDAQTGLATPRVGRPSLTTSQTTPATNNYSVPRDRHAPLIVNRPSDGQLVKVVCKVCGKKDSANVQGFTNHCRIAHGINYASHSEAIVDCGQPVGGDAAPSSSAAAAAAPPQATPAPASTSAAPTAAAAAASTAAGTPIDTKPSSLVNTPVQSQSPLSFASPAQPAGKPFVHPLITAPPPSSGIASHQSLFNAATPLSTKAKVKQAKAKSKAQTQASGGAAEKQHNFVASSSQPKLSALLKKRGFNGDLRSLITSTQQRIDLDQVSPLVSDDEDEEDAKPVQTPTSATANPIRLLLKPKNRQPNTTSGVRMPARAPAAPSRLQINTSSSTTTTSSENHRHLSGAPILANSDASATVSGAIESAPNTSTSDSFTSMDVDQHHNLSVNGVVSFSSNGSSPANLSPHATESMPGLVTDNEDDVDFMDSEHETCTNDDETQRRNDLVDMGVRVRDPDEQSHQGDDMIRPFDHGSCAQAKTPAQAPTSLAADASATSSVIQDRQSNGPSPLSAATAAAAAAAASSSASSSATAAPAAASPRKRGRPRKNL